MYYYFYNVYFYFHDSENDSGMFYIFTKFLTLFNTYNYYYFVMHFCSIYTNEMIVKCTLLGSRS